MMQQSLQSPRCSHSTASAQLSARPSMAQGGALLKPAGGAGARQPPLTAGSKAGHPVVLGAENAGSAVQQRPLLAAKAEATDALGSKKRRRPVAPALDAALADGGAGEEPGSGDEEEGGPRESTLGERVAALQLTDTPAASAEDVQPAEGASITADSLSVLLTQVRRAAGELATLGITQNLTRIDIPERSSHTAALWFRRLAMRYPCGSLLHLDLFVDRLADTRVRW